MMYTVHVCFIFAVIHIGQRPATVSGTSQETLKMLGISCATQGQMAING